jgi:hypothetical protein
LGDPPDNRKKFLFIIAQIHQRRVEHITSRFKELFSLGCLQHLHKAAKDSYAAVDYSLSRPIRSSSPNEELICDKKQKLMAETRVSHESCSTLRQFPGEKIEHGISARNTVWI